MAWNKIRTVLQITTTLTNTISRSFCIYSVLVCFSMCVPKAICVFVDLFQDVSHQEDNISFVSRASEADKTDKNIPIYSSVQKKVSTAVGSSPPKHVKSVSDGAVQTYETVQVISDNVKSDLSKKSTGTSPPPQNTATQVSYKSNQEIHLFRQIFKCFIL